LAPLGNSLAGQTSKISTQRTFRDPWPFDLHLRQPNNRS
jgi:hypothetical protein